MTARAGKLNLKYTDKGIELLFSTRVYELESVMNACYNWVKDYYVFFDDNGADKVRVFMSPKKKAGKKQLETTAGELHNQERHLRVVPGLAPALDQ